MPTTYIGYRLSELLAVGRVEITIACPHCDVRRTLGVADLIDRLGDEVLPTVLTRLTPRCPLRPENGRCMMVYAEPLSRDEEAAIRTLRVSGASPYPVVDWER